MAKTSISIDDDDLKWLRARARRRHGGNLSAAIAEGTQLLRQHERLGKVLDQMGARRLTDADRKRLDREIDGPPAGTKRRRAA